MTTRQQGSKPDRPNRSRGHRQEPRVLGDRVKRGVVLGLGALLLLRGLRRKSARGLVMALVGTTILAKTLMGDTGGDHAESVGPVNRPSAAEPTKSVTVSRSATIGKPADELYDVWRDPDVFSQVMGGFAEVTAIGDDRHRWTVHGPAEMDLSWETRVVEAEPGEIVRWETPDSSTVSNVGSVRFRPASDDRGTVVTLSLTFEPPGGTLASAVLARLDIVPETLAGHVLGRFKSLVESGEIATLEGNPSGRGAGDLV